MLPVTATDDPTGAAFGETDSVSGVTENAAEACSTLERSMFTKYPPDATCGAAMLVEIAPLPSEVAEDAPLEHPVEKVLKQAVKIVVAAKLFPVIEIVLPTRPMLGESSSVGSAEPPTEKREEDRMVEPNSILT